MPEVRHRLQLLSRRFLVDEGTYAADHLRHMRSLLKSNLSGAMPVLHALPAEAWVCAAKPVGALCVMAEAGPVSPTTSTRIGRGG